MEFTYMIGIWNDTTKNYQPYTDEYNSIEKLKESLDKSNLSHVFYDTLNDTSGKFVFIENEKTIKQKTMSKDLLKDRFAFEKKYAKFQEILKK